MDWKYDQVLFAAERHVRHLLFPTLTSLPASLITSLHDAWQAVASTCPLPSHSMLFAKNGTGRGLRRRKVTRQLPVANSATDKLQSVSCRVISTEYTSVRAYATDKPMGHAFLVSCTVGCAFLPPTVFASKTPLLITVYLSSLVGKLLGIYVSGGSSGILHAMLRCCIKVFSVLARIRINCDLHYLSILDQGASALPHLCDLQPPLLPIGPYQIVMQLDTFLQAISRLGLTRWDGIEEDIAWGHVTSLMGLARPSIEGPLFIYRAPIQLGGLSPARVQIRANIHTSPEPILSAIATCFEDLGDPMQVEPWRLIPIDTSRGMSRNRELHHPCYMLVDFRAFRSFGLRPHGVMEVVLGQEEFSFPTVLPVAVNVVSLGEFLAPWLLTGLPGLQWQAWINGDLVGLALIACQEGFFLQPSVVWTDTYAEHGGCGATSQQHSPF